MMITTMATPKPTVKKYGAKRPQFPESLKDIKSYVTLPAAPASVLPNPLTVFGMDGNDQYGDCTMAAAVHSIQVWNTLAEVNDRVPTTNRIVSEYFRLTGGQDSGLVISKVLKTWHTTGLWHNKACGYAPFSTHDLTTLQQVIAFFGLAYIGVEVPQSAETQFDAGQPWSVVTTQTNIVGGHCIPVIGYDADWLYIVTWGAVQKMSRDWFEKYATEAWAIVPEESKQAGSLNGIDFAALMSDLSAV